MKKLLLLTGVVLWLSISVYSQPVNVEANKLRSGTAGQSCTGRETRVDSSGGILTCQGGVLTLSGSASIVDASSTVKGKAVLGQTDPVATASLGTCAAGNRGQVKQLTDGNKGSRVCTLTTGSTYAWVDGRPVFDVRSFGAAVSSTATVNLAAINTAIFLANAATGGGIVEVNDGTYLVNAQVNMLSNVTLKGNGTIKAENAATYDYVIGGTTLSNARIEGITIDANGTNRTGHTTATVGIRLVGCTNCAIDGVTVTGTLGSSGGSSGVGIALAECDTVFLNSNYLHSLGTIARPSDGYYASGTKIQIANSTVKDATDTSFVLEGATYSGISNCISDGTPAAAAITNFLATDAIGNYINGLTVRNWNSVVSGGIAIGTVGSQSGDLLDTTISDVIIIATQPTYGNGPAIRVNNGSSDSGARVKRVTISNPRIYEASTQGILVTGTGAGGGSEEVIIIGGEVRTLAIGSTAISYQGSSTGEVNGTVIIGQGFGVATANTANLVLRNTRIPSYANYAAYAYDTSTIIANFNTVATGGSGQFGRDGGATFSESLNVRTNGLDYAGDGDVRHRDIAARNVTTTEDLTGRALRLNNAQAVQFKDTGGTYRNLFSLTSDATSITRFLAGIDAGGFQFTNQAASASWASLLATGFTANALTGTNNIIASGSGTVRGRSGSLISTALGNTLYFGHSNTEYKSAIGNFNNNGLLFFSAYAYHSNATNDTMARSSGTNVPSWFEFPIAGGFNYKLGAAGTIDTDISSPTTVLSVSSAGFVNVGDTGTATATAGAATLNTQRGTITSESLTTAAGASYTLTLTNSKITTSSMIQVSFFNGTNTAGTKTLGDVTPGSGSATIIIRNTHAADALNGTIKIAFLVM